MCVCVYICRYLSVVYIRRCFHIYVYYGINCIVTQTERQTDTQSQAEPHRNRSSGCATVPPPAEQLSDSSSQVHKSQINQKAAGRTRELQPLQLLLSPDSIRADPIRSDPSPSDASRTVCRFWAVRQRVARLRLLIYTRWGILAAAPAAAAPGPASASAFASEVQRSRRAAAAWKFIYFRAMIWQYFNIQRRQ